MSSSTLHRVPHDSKGVTFEKARWVLVHQYEDECRTRDTRLGGTFKGYAHDILGLCYLDPRAVEESSRSTEAARAGWINGCLLDGGGDTGAFAR